MNILEELIKKSNNKPKNLHYVLRYYKFIIYCLEQNVNLSESIYTEKHHILPKAPKFWPQFINLKLNPWNCAKLTDRQHKLAHWMLARAFGGGMWFAFHKVLYSKTNEQEREINAKSFISKELYRNRVMSEETKLKISISNKGKTGFHNKGKNFSKETRAKIGASRKTIIITDETKAKKSKTMSKLKWYNDGNISKRLVEKPQGWFDGRIVNYEHTFGTLASEETKLKMRESAKNRPRVPCKFCNRLITIPNLQRHEDSCKFNIIPS